jgi:hypothetical protein
LNTTGRERPGYQRPAITDHGGLSELTRSISEHLNHVQHFATLGATFAASTILNPPGTPSVPTPDPGHLTPIEPSSNTIPPVVQGATQSDPTAATQTISDVVGTVHGATSSAGSTEAAVTGGGSVPGASGGGGGGTLPFTGLAVALMAGVGLALASAGATIRRLARR